MQITPAVPAEEVVLVYGTDCFDGEAVLGDADDIIPRMAVAQRVADRVCDNQADAFIVRVIVFMRVPGENGIDPGLLEEGEVFKALWLREVGIILHLIYVVPEYRAVDEYEDIP